MTPLERHQHQIDNAGFQDDAAQRSVVVRLQQLYGALLDAAKGPVVRRWWHRRNRLTPYWTPVRGVYLWGDVGRGKTYLMDLFYASVPPQYGVRTHFHRFMQSVHGELKARRNERDPLLRIAADWSRNMRVLCLDEFFVEDIGDAMILSGLLGALFGSGVTLVTTSNSHPDQLYRDGLQRDRFLPAIELLKHHTDVVQLGGSRDYRLEFLDQAEVYHYPLDLCADANLHRCLEHFSTQPWDRNVELDVLGRPVPARYIAGGVAWFDFRALCDGPRSHADYIEIARRYHTVILSDIPQLFSDDDDMSRRLIELVDVLYDRHVKLIASAAVAPVDLYRGSKLRLAFARTSSRLIEMQSHDYLHRAHLA